MHRYDRVDKTSTISNAIKGILDLSWRHHMELKDKVELLGRAFVYGEIDELATHF